MVTTRAQHAERREGQGSGPAQDIEGDHQRAAGPDFDDTKTYYPIFCLTEVPDEWFKQLDKLTDEFPGECPCIEITSNETDVIAGIKANISSNLRLTPFLRYSIDQLYEFFKSHLRPAEDYSGPGMHFTSFTFLVVDDECLDSDPWQVVLCSDGPDFGEGNDIVLKSKRLPFAEAVPPLCAIEMLVSTMSEIGHPSEMGINIQPTPMVVPLSTDQQDDSNSLMARVATPMEGRENKRKFTRRFASLDEALGNSQPRQPLPQYEEEPEAE